MHNKQSQELSFLVTSSNRSLLRSGGSKVPAPVTNLKHQPIKLS